MLPSSIAIVIVLVARSSKCELYSRNVEDLARREDVSQPKGRFSTALGAILGFVNPAAEHALNP